MKVVIVFNTVARGDVFIYGVSTCMDITSAQVFGINVYCEFSFGVLGFAAVSLQTAIFLARVIYRSRKVSQHHFIRSACVEYSLW